MSFENLNLNANLLKAVAASGFTQPTEIQSAAIPVVLKGRDLMASAQTGTGKTAAFVLPALELLASRPAGPGNGPRVLVLTPTRELAQQVSDNIYQLTKFCKVFSGSVVGGMPYPPQNRMLQRPLDILVATPGRLMDHMERGRVDFSRLEILILDEADRMLDMGFVDAVNDIAAATPENRQTLLFSATLEGRVLDVARKLLKNPERLALAANHDQHALIEQSLLRVDDFSHKQKLLDHLISQTDLKQALIFTATKRGADDLASSLNRNGHRVAALHGDMNQGQRKRTVDRMRQGKVRLLVATDVAARGLDIRGITHVINFDLPMSPEDYIHRIGRTGRGGSEGIAVSLVNNADWGKLGGIERLIGRKLERDEVPGMEARSPEPRFNQSRKPGAKRKFGGKPSFSKNRSGGNGAKAHGSQRPGSNHRQGGKPARKAG